MPQYRTYKNQVKLAPGQKLGFQAGRGYYAIGADGKPVEPVDPMQAQATSSVEAALAPVLAALERQRADSREQREREQQRLGDYYKWAAGEAGNIAPRIQGQYNEAAQTTAAFGKGFSQGMQDALGGSAAQGNALLAQNGAPAGQQIGGNAAAAGDVLFGLGGAIPGQELSQQGAAFSAAAAQLPATAAGMGGMALQDLIREGQDAEKEFSAQLADIEAKRPGLIKDALNELRGLAVQEREQLLKERAYELETGLKIREDARDERAANRADSQLELQWANLQFRNKKDAAAAKKAAARGRQPNAGLSKIYGYMVDSNGEPILGANGKRIPIVKAGTSKGSKGMTESQKSVIVNRARTTGDKALDRFTDRIWDKVDAYFEDEMKARQEYQRRLKLNRRPAISAVENAIRRDLRRAGWTDKDIRREAERIVATQIGARR